MSSFYPTNSKNLNGGVLTSNHPMNGKTKERQAKIADLKDRIRRSALANGIKLPAPTRPGSSLVSNRTVRDTLNPTTSPSGSAGAKTKPVKRNGPSAGQLTGGGKVVGKRPAAGTPGAHRVPLKGKGKTRTGTVTIMDSEEGHDMVYTRGYVDGPAPFPGASEVPRQSGMRFHGVKHEEREFGGKNGRTVQAMGQVWLGQIETPPDNGVPGSALTGSRLGVFPINPAALGSQLALLAKQFEQHRVRHLRVVYRTTISPTVASASGGLVITFINDTSQEQLVLGVSALQQYANNSCFEQFAPWTDIDVDIDPSLANRRFFNDDSGDARIQMEGQIVVMSASDLLSAVVVGNLYLEYDVEFYADYLDGAVIGTYTGSLSLAVSGAAIVTGTAVAPIVAASAGTNAGGTAIVTTSAPAGEYVIIWIPNTSSGADVAAVVIANENNPEGFALLNTLGGVFYFRSNVVATAAGSFSWTSNLRLALYLSLDDALAGQAGQLFADIGSEVMGTNCMWNWTLNPANFLFSGKALFIPIDNQGSG